MTRLNRGWWGIALLGSAMVSCVLDTAPTERRGATSVSRRIEESYPQAAALLAKAQGKPERVKDGFRLATPMPVQTPPQRGGGRWRSTQRPIESDWPSTADGAMVVRLPSLGHELRVRRANATGAAIRLEGHAVSYTDASPGVDSTVFATLDGIEELLVVKSPEAEVAYDLDLPSGWGLRQPNGYPWIVEFLDGAQVPRLRMKADKAWDAAGEEARVAVTVEGRRVRIGVSMVTQWPVVVDPTWTTTGSMAFARGAWPTATLLTSGKVLVGTNLGAELSPAELYDPSTRTFAVVGDTPAARYSAATLLTSGKVLLAGDGYPPVVYDPEAQGGTGAFSPTANGLVSSVGRKSTLLRSGRVLLVGESAAQLYDPAQNGFVAVGGPAWLRPDTTATLLPNGQVLLAGGSTYFTDMVDYAVLFDETLGGGAGGFTPIGSMVNARGLHSAIAMRNGEVLIVAGCGDAQCNVGAPTEVYDPATRTFTQVHVWTSSVATSMFSVALLPSGRPFLAGNTKGSMLFDPSTDSWTDSIPMDQYQQNHGATLLSSGQVLTVGNGEFSGRLAQVYDPVDSPAGSLVPMGSMSGTGPQFRATATMLASGKVLVAGGDGDGTLSEIYDSAAGTLAPTGRLAVSRQNHTATLLPSGKVLVTGGMPDSSQTTYLSSAELFDPGADAGKGAYASAGAMTTPRIAHGAALLASGHVLLAGGNNAGWALASAELFIPQANTFVQTGDLPWPLSDTPRIVPLLDGRALVAGPSATVAVFDPLANGGAGAFSVAGSMTASHGWSFSTSLLADGRVLVAGGVVAPVAELFNPLGNAGAGVFETTGSMALGRISHASTNLPSGKVLVSGGDLAFDTSAELYDPLPGTFTDAGGMSPLIASGFLLPTGKVLSLGSHSGAPASYLWTDASVGEDSWRPELSQVPATVTAGVPVTIGGSGFWPSVEGGARSATNHPVALWMPYQGGGPVLSSLANWSDTSATWTPPITALHGYGLLFVSVSGISSNGVPIKLLPAPTASWALVHSMLFQGICWIFEVLQRV